MNTFEKIYDVVKKIPKGKVASYGTVAAIAGNPRWSRVVGYALHVNPEPDKIPCHRVVTRNGEVSKAFAFGGDNMQRLLLTEEGVSFLADGRVDMKKHGWSGFDSSEAD
ncbi:MAG: MGMT family protein [Ruminococcaceae bacterium]|nr:MGMT family protein [Oscillospiraceae bacterium]